MLNTSIFREIFLFLKTAKIVPEASPFRLGNFFLLLLAVLLLVFPYAGLLELIGIDDFGHKMEEMIESAPILVFFAAVVFAPLLEEVAFRYHLDANKRKVYVSMLISLLFISSSWIIGAIVIAYFLYVLIRVEIGRPASLPFLVYGSSVVFAIIHLSNFSTFHFAQHFYWIPLLVGIQFFLGLILAFLRLHYGMWKAIGFHASYNGIAFTLYFIGKKYMDATELFLPLDI